MKVAICLSGQPRTWRKCLPWWNEMFSAHSNVEFDVFAHLWDFNTETPSSGLAPKPVKVSRRELDDLRQRISPKGFVVESSDIDPIAMLDEHIERKTLPWNARKPAAGAFACSQFYSLMRAAHLKRQHELDHGFEYDAVVRARTDIAFPDDRDYMVRWPRPRRNTVHVIHTNFDRSLDQWRMGDMFFYADSPTFDRLASFYRFMHTIKEDFFGEKLMPPEVPFFYYTRMLRMDIYTVPADPKIVRSQSYAYYLKLHGRSLGDHETL